MPYMAPSAIVQEGATKVGEDGHADATQQANNIFPMECSNQLKNMMINMIIKIVIFDAFSQVPGQTAILAGFAALFYADSCRRYVKS